MIRRKNIRYLIIGHVTGIVLLGVLLYFSGAGNRLILKCLVAGLLFSLVLQWLLYRVKPAWFDNKINPPG